ncbi:SapC family protein [Castellaniella sp.]|uniref:SapC family protein n=1 Tax=Castellaniella sp. TaxID=1955812 RepID=UPI002AFFE8C3|nr:SapC family protein [Castellaniella sp.]
MPDFHAITPTNHADKGWHASPGYGFAAHDTMAVLVMQEIPRACLSLPLALAQSDGHYMPVALQGLAQGQNLLVAPDGRWLADYIPAAYRGYPFALARVGDDRTVLCFDHDSGLLETGGAAGAANGGSQPFFDEQGQPVERVRQILQFLSQVQANAQPTQLLCDALQQHGLIEPWPINIQGDEGKTTTLQGLFRINETALNALSPESFQALREAGALPLAYCQLLSMQHLQRLGILARAHAAQAPVLPESPTGDLDLEFLNSGGTIKFH